MSKEIYIDQKRHTTKTYKKDLHKRLTKEIYKKRPTKETDKRDFFLRYGLNSK